MVVVLFTWIYIMAVSIMVGIGFNKIWCRMTGYSMESLEMYILAGLAVITVYSQVFSLISGLGLAANVLLISVCLYVLMSERSKLREIIMVIPKREHKIKAIVCIAVACVFVVITVQVPSHYDTYLYHAQAIRWIEEYGVVPGLGNLHSRFAYNSSFLVVQALFSFSFLSKMSFHTLNGFLCAVFTIYCINSIKFFKSRTVSISDGLRLILLLYIAKNLTTVSSPNTDTFPLALVVYIFIKWVETLENNDDRIGPYAWLCLMGIYACTLKLSSAFVVILLIKPIIMLVKRRRWKEFGGYVICTFFIVFPFLVRNIIISGYVLYPYPNINIIPLIDWKMDPKIANYDKMEIMVWGRGTRDVVKTYNWPLYKWFPIWVSDMTLFHQASLWGSLISSIGIMIGNIYLVIKRRLDYVLVGGVAIMCLLGWILTAPLIRYGEIYMWIPICMFLLYCINMTKSLNNIVKFICVMLLGVLSMKFIYSAMSVSECPLLIPCDYDSVVCEQVEWQGIEFYIPESGDQTSYFDFPAVPRLNLDEIELRGSNLKDGFRLKQEEN